MALRPDPLLLVDPEVRRCPHALFEALQLDRPVARIAGLDAFVISRYEDVDAIARDSERFSNKFSRALGVRGRIGAVFGLTKELEGVLREALPVRDTLLTADPPEHTRYRALLNRAFTPRRVKGMEARISELAHGLIDGFIESGRVELVSRYAVELPLLVIAEQLGIDPAHRAEFKRWSDDAVASLGGLLSHERQLEVARSLVAFQRYMSVRVEERRRHPKDDLLSALVHAELDGGDRLELSEVLSIVDQLIVAGNETTTTLLANAVLLLLEHPEELARARREPELFGHVVEEALRIQAPVQAMMRIAKQDVTLHGVTIPQGSVVFLSYAAANLDLGQYECPEQFRLDREDPRSHLAFGRGPHHCIGAALARAEGRIGLEALFTRLSDVRLDATRELRTRDHLLLPSITELHLTFVPAAASDLYRREGAKAAEAAKASF